MQMIPKGSVVICHEDDEEDVREGRAAQAISIHLCLCVCANICLMSVRACVYVCMCVWGCVCLRVRAWVCLILFVFYLCKWSIQWVFLTLPFLLCSMRNASGLTAADLAHAQGFRECAEILSNAQNFQQNMAQSHNGVFLNGMSQNGCHTYPTIQGRSFLNGMPNRKRSFEGMEANPGKKARTNGKLLSWSGLFRYFFFFFLFCYLLKEIETFKTLLPLSHKRLMA